MEKRVVFSHKALPYLLLAPQLAITVIFFFLPAGQALWQSFRLEDPFGLSSQFVGLANFAELFANSDYINSFKVTAVFSILVAVLGLGISLLLAVMADRVIKAAAVYKTLLIWPYAVATAVADVLWLFLFSPSVGILAVALIELGIAWNPRLDADDAMTLVVIASVWKQISYNFLFFLAGLQSIPRSLIEAAAIDGASPARRFWTITFPLLSPTTFFLLVINVIYAFFDTFAIIDIMTQGGPGTSTSILVYKVYNAGFKGLDLGSSAAQSVILMFIVIMLTVVQFRYIDRKVNYGCKTASHDSAPSHTGYHHPPCAACRGGRHCLSVVCDLRGVHPDRAGSRPGTHVAAAGQPLPGELLHGVGRRRGQHAASRPHDVDQHRHGACDCSGQDHDLHAVRLCRGVFPLPLPDVLLLDDICDADAARRSAHCADLPGRGRPGHAQQLCRPDLALDRFGNSHLSVPPVFPDSAR